MSEITNKELSEFLRSSVNNIKPQLSFAQKSLLLAAAERLAAMPDANAEILFSADIEQFSPYGTLESALLEVWENEGDEGNLAFYTVYEARLNDGVVYAHNIRSRVFRKLRESEDFDFDNFEEVICTDTQQPVAWMDIDGCLHTTKHSAEFSGRPAIELYTRPQQPGARKP